MKVELTQLIMTVQVDGVLIAVERLGDGTLTTDGVFAVPTASQKVRAAKVYQVAEEAIQRDIA